MPTMKKSGTKKFVKAPESFLRLAVVRRGLFAAVFVFRVVPRFCIAIIFDAPRRRGDSKLNSNLFLRVAAALRPRVAKFLISRRKAA